MFDNITIGSTVYIYPYIQTKKDFFQTEISQDKIAKIKKMLSKKKLQFEKYHQKEYFYKNLLKTEKDTGDKVIAKYFSLEPSNFACDDNNLITWHNQEIISENEFPSLAEYDRISEKQIESYVFNKFEFIIESEDENTIVKIYIENFQHNVKNDINEILALL